MKLMNNSDDFSFSLETRKVVIAKSLVIEATITKLLGWLLNVTDFESSITLSNKNTALSLNQKVCLLIDAGALDRESKTKFITFMEIRNQFVHNINATSYVECFSFLDGKEKYILKLYPQDGNLSKEMQLHNAVSSLGDELNDIAMLVSQNIHKRKRKEDEGEASKKLLECMVDALNVTHDEFNRVFGEMAAEGVMGGSEVFGKMGSLFSNVYSKKFVESIKSKHPDLYDANMEELVSKHQPN